MATISDVKLFWSQFPLWTGESKYPEGTPEFFHEQKEVVISDTFAGKWDERIFSLPKLGTKVLDLGCGPGLYATEFAKRGYSVVAADLTEKALVLAEKRSRLLGVPLTTSLQNAESLTFADGTFGHVNCLGVIHHTPDTAACVHEISRVLEKNGTATISVYYKNFLVRSWPILRFVGILLNLLGAGLRGRGRENIFMVSNVNEIVRYYDGKDNPIGKAYTKNEFARLLEPYFEVELFYLHFFPARALPVRIPFWLHRWLDRHFGFLIYAVLRKKS